MPESVRMDRTGKKKERGNEESVELTPGPDVTTLSLYSNVLFIRLLVPSSSGAICPSIPSVPFSPALLHCILPGRLVWLKFWLEYIPGEKKKNLEEDGQRA